MKLRLSCRRPLLAVLVLATISMASMAGCTERERQSEARTGTPSMTDFKTELNTPESASYVQLDLH